MLSSKPTNIAVLGAGSWGIALANHCAGLGRQVTLWEFDAQVAQLLQTTRMREQVLKNIRIDDSIIITSSLAQSITAADLILFVIPSHVARGVMQEMAKIGCRKESVCVSCTKGIENVSHMRISEIFNREAPQFSTEQFAVLSGPSHAEEVSRQIPTAVVVASQVPETALFVQEVMNSINFRIYTSTDIIGVELGGALKNVIAIAAGICDGAGFGDNTKAALQPRGLAEIIRLGRKLGADPHTFAGLSGMGDLIVTCMSHHSRNRYLGEQIGQGRTLDEVMKSMVMVAEGVRTCKSAVALSEKYDVEMPICRQVYDVLFANKEPKAALRDLMNRDVKPEVWY